MSYCERGCIKLERAANGYTVTMRDPAIDKANAKRSMSKSDTTSEPYRDSTKEYVFTDLKTALAFISKNADKALPDETYESAFEALSDGD